METENATFINMYINILTKEIEEVTKQKIILMAKEQFNNTINDSLNQKIRELEPKLVEFDNVKSELEKIKTENLNLKNGVIESETLRRTLDQTKELLQRRERELEENRHSIIALKDEITAYKLKLEEPKKTKKGKNSSKEVNTSQ